MMGNKELFSSLDDSISFEIKLGDDYKVKALGKGVVTIVSNQDETMDNLNVDYVPTLKHNLISVGKLSENGYEIKFNNPICTILDKPPSKGFIAHVNMTKNRMFPLRLRYLNTSMSYAQNITNLDEVWLWHLTYGHLSSESLIQLQNKSMVNGILVINAQNHSCETCILVKHQRDGFPLAATYRAKDPIELVHTDLCGPM